MNGPSPQMIEAVEVMRGLVPASWERDYRGTWTPTTWLEPRPAPEISRSTMKNLTHHGFIRVLERHPANGGPTLVQLKENRRWPASPPPSYLSGSPTPP